MANQNQTPADLAEQAHRNKGEAALSAIYRPERGPQELGKIQTEREGGELKAYTSTFDQVTVKEFDATEAMALKKLLKTELTAQFENSNEAKPGEKNGDEQKLSSAEIDRITTRLAEMIYKQMDRMKVIDEKTLQSFDQLSANEQNGLNLLVIEGLMDQAEDKFAEIGFKPDNARSRSMPNARVYSYKDSNVKLVCHYAWDGSPKAEA